MSDPTNTASVAAEAKLDLSKIPVPFPGVAMAERKFHFKKNELGDKRPSVTLALPLLTIEGLIAALEDTKKQEIILSAVNELIVDQARIQVGDDNNPVNSQEQLDVSKLSFDYIANLPPAERRGGGIAKEIWEAFGKDYLAVMPAVTGKTAEQCGNAAKLFLAKFQPCKTNKPVLKKLQELLALYAGTTSNLEEFQDCVKFLDSKITDLLNADEASLLANL